MVGKERVRTSKILLYLRNSGVMIRSIDRQFKNRGRDNPMKKKTRQRHNTMIVAQKMRLTATK